MKNKKSEGQLLHLQTACLPPLAEKSRSEQKAIHPKKQ